MTQSNIYDDLPVVVDVKQAATILGCGQRLIRDLIASGELGHVRLGRLIRIPRHELVALLEGLHPQHDNAIPHGDEVVEPV